MLAAAGALFQLALGVYSAIPPFFRGIIAGAVVLAFLYEGVPPFPVELPFIGEVSLVDGRVDRVRKEADARCEYRIQKSIEAATKTDADISADRIRQSQLETAEANERALAAQSRLNDYQMEIDRLEPAVRDCRRANESDLRRLQ